MIELPKWPRLLVKGKRITREQADVVIIRTTSLRGLHCNDDRWNRYVKQAFQLYKEPNLIWASDEAWTDLERRLGVLDLQYLDNEQVSTVNVEGPCGWCWWDGTVGADGIGLGSKWPRVGEVWEEWQKIATAFPFLSLTAQLVRTEWNYDTGEITGHTPLVTWTVEQGEATLHDEPGDLIRSVPEEEDVETAVRRGMRRDAEIGVHHKRLTEAVRRCERAVEKGK